MRTRSHVFRMPLRGRSGPRRAHTGSYSRVQNSGSGRGRRAAWAWAVRVARTPRPQNGNGVPGHRSVASLLVLLGALVLLPWLLDAYATRPGAVDSRGSGEGLASHLTTFEGVHLHSPFHDRYGFGIPKGRDAH
jgi:hypothetical protein